MFRVTTSQCVITLKSMTKMIVYDLMAIITCKCVKGILEKVSIDNILTDFDIFLNARCNTDYLNYHIILYLLQVK